ncbi:acyl-CoA N-acyltransferase [Xylaria cf. heliscus]|nr:acyl-CoA N-acyltransferase [Xylaria cf. heliscus]
MSQPKMNTMIDAIGSAFRSERLTYRAIEDNEADKSFIFTHLSDPVTHALANPAIHRPLTRKISDEKTVARLRDAMLAVMICVTGDSPASPEPIGCCWIVEAQPYQRRGSLGIWISTAHQNKGYGFEAVNWAMDWAFKWGGLHSLVLGASLYNERAVAVYKKAGFKQEGVSREAVYRDRKWLDTVQLAILEQEWEELRGIKK